MWVQGRQLSLIFLKLPSKHEYPDYYDIIKRPIDLEKIYTKARGLEYLIFPYIWSYYGIFILKTVREACSKDKRLFWEPFFESGVLITNNSGHRCIKDQIIEIAR